MAPPGSVRSKLASLSPENSTKLLQEPWKSLPAESNGDLNSPSSLVSVINSPWQLIIKSKSKPNVGKIESEVGDRKNE